MDSDKCPHFGRRKTYHRTTTSYIDIPFGDMERQTIQNYTFYNSKVRAEVGHLLLRNINLIEETVNSILDEVIGSKAKGNKVKGIINRKLSGVFFEIFISDESNNVFEFSTFNRIYRYSNATFFWDLHKYFNQNNEVPDYKPPDYDHTLERLTTLYGEVENIQISYAWMAIITEGGFLGIFSRAINSLLDNDINKYIEGFDPSVEFWTEHRLYTTNQPLKLSETQYRREANSCPAESLVVRVLYLFACNFINKYLNLPYSSIKNGDQLRTIPELNTMLQDLLLRVNVEIES